MYRVRALTLPSEKLCEKNGRSEFLCRSIDVAEKCGEDVTVID